MITDTFTLCRKMVFPKQWYAQRARSESYANSDVEQYQDAADSLMLEMSNIVLSSASSEIVTSSSTSTEYLEIGPSRTSSEYLELGLGHTSSEYLELGSGHASSEYLDLGRGHTSLELDHVKYLELGPGHTRTHVSSLTMESFMGATGEVIVVANDVEVSCEEVEESGAGVADQSEASGKNLEGLLEDNGDHA